MAKFYPSLENIQDLKVKPTKGEQEMLDFLATNFNDEYEVFYQPHLNGLLPDFVIVHQNHGALVVEVKDWTLNLYQRQNFQEWIVYAATGEGETIRSPFYQAKLYKDALCELYLRVLSDNIILNKKFYGVIETGVYFSKASSQDLFSFVHDREDSEKRILYWGKDDLSSFDSFCQPVSPYFTKRTSYYFTQKIYEEMVRVLNPTDHVRNIKKNIQYTPDQLRLSESKPCHQTKIRGVAGSGKTEVLAKLAVNAYRRVKSPVLVVLYNITLVNYLHDRINALREDIPMKAFSIIHYHALKKYYDSSRNFKVVLVDEIQDFEREWVEDLRNHWLDKSGNDWEIVFFGDEKQDLYQRSESVQEENAKRPYTGISGNWNKLKSSFRLGSHVAELAEDFEREFAENKNDIDHISILSNIFDESQVKYMHQDTLNPERICNICRSFITQIPAHQRTPDNDIVFLGNYIESVRWIDQYLRLQKKYQTSTTFETEEEYQKLAEIYKDDALVEEAEKMRRAHKFNFWPEAGKLKLSTVHSFKGWELETVFVIIDNNLYKKSNLTTELLYTAFTRAIKNLIIIEIGNGEYTPFFQKYFQNKQLDRGLEEIKPLLEPI